MCLDIQRTTGKARYLAWNEKRVIGEEARLYLLAYAFARGVPYRVVEPTAREKPSECGASVEAWRDAFASSIAFRTCAEADLAKEVRAWLEVPEAADRRARREAREASARAARAARRSADARRVA